MKGHHPLVAGVIIVFSLISLLGLLAAGLSEVRMQRAALEKIDAARTAGANLRAELAVVRASFSGTGTFLLHDAADELDSQQSRLEHIATLLADLKIGPIDRHDVHSDIRTGLSSLNPLIETERAAILRLTDPGTGALAAYEKARNESDRTFTRVSEQVALPTEQYLATRHALGIFLKSQDPASADAALQTLDNYVRDTSIFSGLTDTQRDALTTSGRAFRRACVVVADLVREADLARHEIRTGFQHAMDLAAHLIADTEADATAQTLVLVSHGTRLEIEIGAFGILTTLFLAATLFYAYRRIARLGAEEKRLAEKLSVARRFEALGNLAGGIAHDFNNIVNATRGYADLLVLDLPAGDQAHRYARKIVAICDRAAALIEEIGSFSNTSAVPQEPVQIQEILSGAGDFLVGLRNKSVGFVSDDKAGGAWVTANRAQMVQIVANLTLNAADALPSSGGLLRLATEILDDAGPAFAGDGDPAADHRPLTAVQGAVDPRQPYVRISVEDSGEGMTADVLAKIFEPFFTTKEKARGTGLGLALVAGIVSAHRGAIRVATGPGRGTRFDVFIPCTSEPSPRAVIERPAPPSQSDVRGRERILIVDDEAAVAEVLTTALSRWGYEAAGIYFPREALETFREDPSAWDVVVSDLSMPRMSGLDLLAELKSHRPDLKTILFTGYNEPGTREAAEKLGVDAFLSKPIAAEDVARTIRRISG